MAQQPRVLDPDASPRARFGATLRQRRLAASLSLARLAAEIPLHPDTLAKYEKAERWPAGSIVEILDRVLNADGVLLQSWRNANSDDAEIRIAPTFRRRGWSLQSCEMQRRSFLPGAAAMIAGPSLLSLLDVVIGLDRFDRSAPLPTMAVLESQVAAVKARYQACRYASALADLPGLLQVLAAGMAACSPAAVPQAHALLADAYHVTASLLLKLGEPATALLAADRSSRHSRASGDPVALGASARIMTHALTGNGHGKRASRLAQRALTDLDDATGLTSDDANAVYGALALRGAVAATRSGDHDDALALLRQADRAAARLGGEGNARWTGFGPANVALHRINIALTSGDAATAIRFARLVQRNQLVLAERKAALFLDVAQAYAIWDRHEDALVALRTADRIAPEEVRRRPAVRLMVSDLCSRARGPVRDRAAEFASALGITG